MALKVLPPFGLFLARASTSADVQAETKTVSDTKAVADA